MGKKEKFLFITMIDGNISMEEDTELRDLVVQTLENNGVLAKLRVCLEIFLLPKKSTMQFFQVMRRSCVTFEKYFCFFSYLKSLRHDNRV